jgi:hypothetical protein
MTNQEAFYVQKKANIEINGICGKGVSPEENIN